MHSEATTWMYLVDGSGSLFLSTPIDDDSCRHYRYPIKDAWDAKTHCWTSSR